MDALYMFKKKKALTLPFQNSTPKSPFILSFLTVAPPSNPSPLLRPPLPWPGKDYIELLASLLLAYARVQPFYPGITLLPSSARTHVSSLIAA